MSNEKLKTLINDNSYVSIPVIVVLIGAIGTGCFFVFGVEARVTRIETSRAERIKVTEGLEKKVDTLNEKVTTMGREVTEIHTILKERSGNK